MTNLANYTIGLHDGKKGDSGFLGILLQSDPDYRQGLAIGTSQGTLREIREARQDARKSDQALQSMLRGLGEMMRAGHSAIIEQIEVGNELLSEQIAIERTKNLLIDVEPYLVSH